MSSALGFLFSSYRVVLQPKVTQMLYRFTRGLSTEAAIDADVAVVSNSAICGQRSSRRSGSFANLANMTMTSSWATTAPHSTHLARPLTNSSAKLGPAGNTATLTTPASE